MQFDNYKSKWMMLGLSYLALIGCFLPYIGYSTKLPQIMEDTSINYAQAGMLASVTALVGGLYFRSSEFL